LYWTCILWLARQDDTGTQEAEKRYSKKVIKLVEELKADRVSK